MKLLWLGNSDDRAGVVPEAELAPYMAAERLGKTLGEPVEITVRTIWPTPGLPGLIDRWMQDTEPDFVLVRNTYYWMAYPSVPNRIRRVLGVAGRPIAGAVERSAEVPWLAHTRPYHFLRGVALRTIGGDPPFPIETLIERMSEVIRTVVRYEDAVPAVIGPEGNIDYSTSAKGRAELEGGRMTWHGAIRQLCGELHVDYLGYDEPVFAHHQKGMTGDRVHSDAKEQARRAEYVHTFLLQAWTNAGRLAEPASSAMPAIGEL